MSRLIIAVIVTLATASSAYAQHEHRGQHAQAAEIKALSPEQVADYLAGAGMGLAKAAELNHYPGPKHAFELADSLRLTSEQIDKIRQLRERVVTEASNLGARIIEKERALDKLFAMTQADSGTVAKLTSEIAALNGKLRAVHLTAHIETRARLSSEQIARYDRLRWN